MILLGSVLGDRYYRFWSSSYRELAKFCEYLEPAGNNQSDDLEDYILDLEEDYEYRIENGMTPEEMAEEDGNPAFERFCLQLMMPTPEQIRKIKKCKSKLKLYHGIRL